MIWCQTTSKRETACFRHNNVFHKTTFSLSRTSKKPEFPACVMPAGKTLITFPARHSWFNRYIIAGVDSLYRFAYFNNFSGPFMTQCERILHFPVSYTHLRAHETDSYLVC